MITGSFFAIGTTHQVCQDYASSGNGYAIVSDGCSDPRCPHTDWGSRILCKAAEQWLIWQKEGKLDKFWKEVAKTAQAQQQVFNLPPTCLTATLLTAFEIGDNIETHMMGDGFIAGRRRDLTWEIHSYEFPSGAPYYLRYEYDLESREGFLTNYGAKVQHDYYKTDAVLQVTNHEGELFDLADRKPYFQHSFPMHDFDLVVIGSDGARSFYQPVITPTSRFNKSVSFTEVLPILLSFQPVLEQKFLEAHCNWLFKRAVSGTFVKKDWHHSDDLSLGAVYCGG